MSSNQETPARQGEKQSLSVAPGQVVMGRVRVTQAGFALVKVADEDVLVPEGALGQALEGDDVEVAVVARAERGPRGRVLRVLSRMPRRLCGIVDAGYWFLPDDSRYSRPLRCGGYLPGPEEGPLLCGGELLARFSGDAEVRIDRCFGRHGSPWAEEEALLWRGRMDEVFSAAALAEVESRARAVREGQEAPQRVDFRNIEFVTLAADASEAADTALFATRLPDGSVRLFVAVAEVSAFVLPGSALDVEACRRSLALHLPRRVVPMLPAALAHDVAAFLPGEERTAIVLELRLDPDAQIRSRRAVLATIRTRAQWSYDEVSNVLEGRGASGTASAPTLVALDQLAQNLRARRSARGAMAIKAPEVIVETDDITGLPVWIGHAAHDAWVSRAHQMQEELTLLANKAFSAMLKEQKAGAAFRIRDALTEQRALRLSEAVCRHATDFEPTVPLVPRAFGALLRKIVDPGARDEITSFLTDSMLSSFYALHRQDHVAVPSRDYVSCTSPTRRYSDLVVQRAVRACIAGAPLGADALDPDTVNRRWQRARGIQREVGELYAALLMQERVGEKYRGTILQKAKRHWVVALDDPAICVRCRRPEAALDVGFRVVVRIEQVSIAQPTVEASFVAGLAE